MNCPIIQQFPNLFELTPLKTSVSAPKISPAVEIALYPEVLIAGYHGGRQSLYLTVGLRDRL